MQDDSFKQMLTQNLKATPEDSPYAGEALWNRIQINKKQARRGFLWKLPIAIAALAVMWVVFVDSGDMALSDEERFLYTEWSEMMEDFNVDQDTTFVLR